MKKLLIIALLFLGLQSFGQIGDLYIYNFSSMNIDYQLLAFPNSSCYPSFEFKNPPSSSGFTVASGDTHVYNGFLFPTSPGFPSGSWTWGRKTSATTFPTISMSPASAQTLAGNAPAPASPSSPIQARWKYFKFNGTASIYGGIGFTSSCLGLPSIYTNGTFTAEIFASGTDTIVIISD